MNQLAGLRNPVIAVIGGGFSGAAFALHLLRDVPSLPVAIDIIEPRATLGAGLAYSAPDADHRINVAASRMSVFAEDPTHFDRWFRATGLADDPQAEAPGFGLYPRRAAFGRYVDRLLAEAVRGARAAQFRHVRNRAVEVMRRGTGFVITLADGQHRHADVVVLAVGHPDAEPPPALRDLADDPALIANPWMPESLAGIAADARVAIIGTGLTMTDVLASLNAAGHHGPVTALSRRGLLPRPRTPLPVTPRGSFATDPARTALDLLRGVRAEIAAGSAAGLPWEGVIDALRAQGGAVWNALPPGERQRLLRHLQPYWDTHRYQCAPQIDALLRQSLASGHLHVVAASLRGAARQPGGAIRLQAHPRGAPEAERLTLTCDVVINCTGPAHRQAIAPNPALRTLCEAGLIRPDPYGLGIAVDAEGYAIDVAGQPAANLLVVGPPARGTWGELMGLPQVSTQPREVAGRLAMRLHQQYFTHAQEADA